MVLYIKAWKSPLHLNKCKGEQIENQNSSGIFKRGRDFPGSPGLRLHAFTEGVMSLIPGQGTNKIPYAAWCDQKKKGEREGRIQGKYLPPETGETGNYRKPWPPGAQTQEQRPP